MNIKGRLYRLIMRIAHKYHWHYAPPIYPEGDTQLWCKWCGFRQTILGGPHRIADELYYLPGLPKGTHIHSNVHLDGKKIADEIMKIRKDNNNG